MAIKSIERESERVCIDTYWYTVPLDCWTVTLDNGETVIAQSQEELREIVERHREAKEPPVPGAG